MRRTAGGIWFHGGLLSNWAATPFDGRVAWRELRERLDAIGVEGRPDGIEITGRLRGRRYPNVETWMMACKAWAMGDLASMTGIQESGDPRTVKAIGRDIRPFDERLWNLIRVPVVTSGCIAKFTHSPRMESELLETAELLLCEGARHDRVWGVGIDWRDARIEDRANWRGLNLLGECLMEARRAIRERSVATNA